MKAAVLAADTVEMDRACDDIVTSGASTTMVPAMRTRAAALREEQAASLARPPTKELLPPIIPMCKAEAQTETRDEVHEGKHLSQNGTHICSSAFPPPTLCPEL